MSSEDENEHSNHSVDDEFNEEQDDDDNDDNDNDHTMDDDDDDVDDDSPSDNVNHTVSSTTLSSSSSRKRKRPIVDPAAVQEFTEQERQKGIVYLSRIPPYMKPVKIRHLLSQNGEIGRIYLAPEDPLVYRKRVQAGGNKKIKYTEGWVEFLNKHQAKAAAKLLQNTPVDTKHGGRGFYASDLWNIKYLKHFKWHHLTEKIAYEKRLKAIQLRSELHENKKSIEQYLSSVDTAKAITEMENKKAKQKKKNSNVVDKDDDHDRPKSSVSPEPKSTVQPTTKTRKDTSLTNTITTTLRSSTTTTPSTLTDTDSHNIRRKFKQKEALQDKALQALMNP